MKNYFINCTMAGIFFFMGGEGIQIGTNNHESFGVCVAASVASFTMGVISLVMAFLPHMQKILQDSKNKPV